MNWDLDHNYISNLLLHYAESQTIIQNSFGAGRPKAAKKISIRLQCLYAWGRWTSIGCML